MTRVLPQASRNDDTETREGNENVPDEEDILPDRLSDAFMSLQDILMVSQANKIYDILFHERENLKLVFTTYSSMKSLLRSKSDKEQTELFSHAFKKD